MKAPLKEKKINRTYRNGTNVYQLDLILRIRTNIAETKWLVTEQRAAFKDEKTVFAGSEVDAEKFFDESVSTVVYGSSSPYR